MESLRKGIDFIGSSVVFTYHDGEGNYLVSKRSAQCRDEQGTWEPGGGAIEFGDTILDTLRKEIAEEYCTDVVNYEFLGLRDVLREQNGIQTHWIAHDFKVLIDRSKVSIGEPHKMEEIGWFTPNNFPTPLHSQYPYFLEKYKEML